MKFPITTIAFILLSLVFAQMGEAQLEKLFSGGGEKPSALLVPQNGCIAAAIFPKKITSNEALKLFPHEIVTAWGKKELGFDPMLIKQATWLIKTPENLNDPPVWAAVLHFEEMQGLSGRMIDDMEEKKIGGKDVFSASSPAERSDQRSMPNAGPMPSFMVFDEATMVIGIESFFEDMLILPGGKVTKLFEARSVEGQAFGFIDVETLRPVLDEASQAADNLELSPPIERLKQIPSLLETIAVGLETQSKLEAKIVMKANSPADGEELNEIIIDAMEYGRVTMLAQMSQQMDLNDPVQVATIQYAKRMAEKYEQLLSPVVDGKELTVTVPQNVMTTLPMLIGSIGSAANVRFSGPNARMTAENQLKHSALAFHNYASAYQKFPPRVVLDDNGRPLYSSRVSMLPFIEQNNLYDSMRLDEPWDSQHNSQFTSMVIEAYGATEEGLSTVRYPVFPGSMWAEDRELDFKDIRDGTSNTIFAIHAPPESATSWADPTPWIISKDNPMKDVFGDRDEVIVAMLDGSTRTLQKADMTNAKLKAMLTISGGEVLRD